MHVPIPHETPKSADANLMHRTVISLSVTVYSMKYALGLVVFCFVVLYWWLRWMHLPILFRVTSLEFGQTYDCSSASEVTLNNMVKIGRCLITTKHDKAQTTCIISGMHFVVYSVSDLRNLLQDYVTENGCLDFNLRWNFVCIMWR